MTINALTSAKRLDWSSWLLGIWGATISGGAGAIAAGFANVITDPKDFNVFQGGGGKLFIVMGITFGIAALISMMKYLQLHPNPDYVPQQPVAQVETTTKITPVDPNQPVSTTTTNSPVMGPIPPVK